MNRRNFLALSASTALLAAQPRRAVAALPAELRIGFQKNGPLLVARQQKLIEAKFESQGVAVRWLEFPFGPPLLEALNAGSIDYGTTGDAPPVFAQAARANLLYVAALPGRGGTQGIIVPPDSPIRTIQDVKGRRVAIARASSAHSLAVAALEAVGLTFGDIVPVYLPPADAAGAFARGSVDAWSIWDPFLAIAELTRNARQLPVSKETLVQNSFFLANRDFAVRYPHVVANVNEAVADAAKWAAGHREEAAVLFSQATNVDLQAQRRAVARTDFTLSPITDRIVAQQQAVADRFHRLGLIPAPVVVRDIVWTWTQAA
jgi:aliphatic sulfonates family ABC transporter substrate-binding protein